MRGRLYLRLFHFEDEVSSSPRLDPMPPAKLGALEGPSHAGPEAHDALRVRITVTTRRRVLTSMKKCNKEDVMTLTSLKKCNKTCQKHESATNVSG